MIAVTAALTLAAIGSVTAQQVVTETYGPGTDLRALARQHLGNADLWPEILKASGARSVTELEPGQSLQIPVETIGLALDALDVSLTRIQDANAAGAQLFAPDLISAAIDDRDKALDHSVRGAWADTLDLAQKSTTSATEAIAVSVSSRDQRAQARLSDRQGRVEGQRPADLAWNDRDLNAILIEEEKIRTLSASTAQVTFRDASRLRLNANSQAVIQRLRVDPLNQREEAKVNLIKGDFYALLGGASQRKRFNVELADVDAKIDSGNFWVRSEAGRAKFANYDEAPVEINARNERVTLGRNEGTVITEGSGGGGKVTVLAAPDPVSPGQAQVLYTPLAALEWQSVRGARGYWIEIAADPAFDSIVESRWGVEAAHAETKPLEPGAYYWRVTTLDRFGLPGPHSESLKFEVRVDTSAPFLRIDTPASGTIIRRAMLEITGETEPGASVTIAGERADIDAAGRYRARVSAREGENVIEIVATDPAGNETRKTRSVIYMPDRAATLQFDADLARLGEAHFLSNGDAMTLSGITTPHARLAAAGADGRERVSARSGADGRFRFNLPLTQDREAFTVDVIAPSGHRSARAIEVTRDQAPPSIRLDRPLPRLTGTRDLAIAGSLEKGATLSVNDKPVAVADGEFETKMTLSDGDNPIKLTAIDRAGNVTAEIRVVRLDRTAPELVRHALDINAARISIEIEAADMSGLANIARFGVDAGGRRYSGYLRLNRATGIYAGALDVPMGDAAGARLTSVELEDDARNKKIFELN